MAKKDSPLKGYVTLIEYLKTPRTEIVLEELIEQEMNGKRRDTLLRTLIARLYKIRKRAALKTLGVKLGVKHGR